MKSHIQLPKSVLKNFSFKTDEGKKTCFIDVESLEIGVEKINELGTSEGFYPESAEKRLSKYIEGPLGPIMRKFKDFENNKVESLTITSNEFNSIKWFINYLIFRSDNFVKQVNDMSVTSIIFGDLKRHIFFGMENQVKALDIFKEFGINVLLNLTNTCFIVPRNGFYYYRDSKDKCTNIIFPFTPKIAFVLKSDGANKKYIYDGYLYHMKVHDDESVRRMNWFAYNVERETNGSFLAGLRKDELSYIRERVLNHIE